MNDPQLVVDLALAIVVAFVGGNLAHRLGQPVILGYLLAGVAIGPFAPGPTASPHSVQVLAEIGVAFLMFALGAELSIAELRRIGRVAVVGGALQILCTMGLGPLLAPLLGLTFAQGVFLGALLALSSTVVALKVLLERGDLGALHGRVALGILIAQDLAVVPMVVLLPSVVGGGESVLGDLASAAIKAALVLLGAYVIGVRLVPLALRHAAVSRTRELFLLGVVGLALGTAVVTQFCWAVASVWRLSGWPGGRRIGVPRRSSPRRYRYAISSPRSFSSRSACSLIRACSSRKARRLRS